MSTDELTAWIFNRNSINNPTIMKFACVFTLQVQFLWVQKTHGTKISTPTGWTTKIQLRKEAEILFFLLAPCQPPSPSSALPSRYRGWGDGGGQNGQSREPEISPSMPRPCFRLSVLNIPSIFAFIRLYTFFLVVCNLVSDLWDLKFWCGTAVFEYRICRFAH